MKQVEEEHNVMQRRNRCGYSVKYPREENIYRAMWNRCMNPNHASYKRYGAKGVTICERWLGYYGLQNFIDDMGLTPTDEKLPSGRSVWSIDRIDSTKDYSPDNCRWTNYTVQNFNRKDWSGHRGIYKVSYYNKGLGPYTYWRAQISWKGKRKMKSFKTEEEAIAQRKQWEKEIPLD